MSETVVMVQVEHFETLRKVFVKARQLPPNILAWAETYRKLNQTTRAFFLHL